MELCDLTWLSDNRTDNFTERSTPHFLQGSLTFRCEVCAKGARSRGPLKRPTSAVSLTCRPPSATTACAPRTSSRPWTGRRRFKAVSETEFKDLSIPNSERGNAFMLLRTFIPTVIWPVHLIPVLFDTFWCVCFLLTPFLSHDSCYPSTNPVTNQEYLVQEILA